MAKLAISLFGPLRVALDEALVSAFESDKAWALLAYLVVEADHAHRREVLGACWQMTGQYALARRQLERVLDLARSDGFQILARQGRPGSSSLRRWGSPVPFTATTRP